MATTLEGPGGSYVYIKQNGSALQFSYDQSSWNELSIPCFISNTNTSTGFFKVKFITDITLTSAYDYLLCLSDKIQIGSETLNNDGSRPKIIIDGVNNYHGFIQNFNNVNGYNDIYVFNLEVYSINGSTLLSENGWLCQSYFGVSAQNNCIINCYSDGNIGDQDGGIIGSYAGSGSGADLKLIGCSSSGAISGNSSGGILGWRVGYNGGSITCDSCWSTGIISGNLSGGISGGESTNINITNCYSSGFITGTSAGGIAGSGCNSANIQKCYSQGNINGSSSGGIIGGDSLNIVINNCYSLGDINGSSNAGGISGSNPTSYSITHCYTSGSITTSKGFIIGNNITIPSNCFSEASVSSSGWNSTNANTVLLGIPNSIIGTTWVNTYSNQPYELLAMGYTPYSLTNINVNLLQLQRTNSYTITAGSSTTSAIISGKSYTILQNPYTSISINSTTGVINTTNNTVAGIYTFYIRNTGSYNMSVFILTINSIPQFVNNNVSLMTVRTSRTTRNVYSPAGKFSVY